MNVHLHVRTRAPSVPAAERRRQAEARARLQCSRGHHSMTNTFRPNEQVCLVCGLVTYCPACLDRAHLLRPQNEHAYPMECAEHKEVQA
jgi:hypothetical protein